MKRLFARYVMKEPRKECINVQNAEQWFTFVAYLRSVWFAPLLFTQNRFEPRLFDASRVFSTHIKSSFDPPVVIRGGRDWCTILIWKHSLRAYLTNTRDI